MQVDLAVKSGHWIFVLTVWDTCGAVPAEAAAAAARQVAKPPSTWLL